MLAFHVIPDIENAYLKKIGVLENEAFLTNMKLLRINRKIEIYKERKKYNIEPNEEEIEEQLNIEFSDIEEEYNDMQEEIYYEEEEDYSDGVTAEFLKLINMIYKNLIKKLSPLINFNNTMLDNQLYDLLERSYKELDLNLMSKLQIICDQRKNDSSLIIGDVKTLKKAKKTYENLIDENEEIILNIKCSEIYNKKRILEDENLLNRKIDEINKEIEKINSECQISEKELEDLMNS